MPLKIKKKISRVSRGGRSSANAQLRKLLPSSADISIRTGRTRGTGTGGAIHPYPEPPVTWPGTRPEWAVNWAHLAIGLKPDQDFAYQYGLGDQGAVLDFFELDIQVGINIQGLFWHYGMGAAKVASDREQQIRIESLGIPLIFIDEDNALDNPIFFLREARAGRDHSRAALGMI